MARSSWPILLCVVIFTGSVQADLIALKRDGGLAFTDGSRTDNLTDVRFASAVVVTTTVGDTSLFMANPGSTADWYNYGASTALTGGIQLYKFDLSAVPALAGGVINLAELRLHNNAGNSGGAVGRIVTHDWLEGTKDSDFPGPAGGASCSHPWGFNTASHRNATDGTDPPLTSWGPGSDSRFDAAVDGDMERASKAGTHIGYGWQVFDVTDIVAAWTQGNDPAPNYGFYLVPGNYVRHSSEMGWDLQPVLFVDFVPEPATLGLLAAGVLVLLNRRRNARA